jgi:hypothetical protein
MLPDVCDMLLHSSLSRMLLFLNKVMTVHGHCVCRCETIQFITAAFLSGDGSELILAFGVNDCDSRLQRLPLAEVLAFTRKSQPQVGEIVTPSPDICASRCVAPCGTAGRGTSGNPIGSIRGIVDPCDCCKRCCARLACKSWELCTGATCAKDRYMCWLKMSIDLGKATQSTAGLRPEF